MSLNRFSKRLVVKPVGREQYALLEEDKALIVFGLTDLFVQHFKQNITMTRLVSGFQMIDLVRNR